MNEEKDFRGDRDYDAEVHYRPMNPLAMVALLLAMLGSLTIATLILLPLNIAAAAMGIVVIRQSGKNRRFSGGRVAVFSLLLAVVTGMTALTYHVGRDWYLKDTARRYSMMVLQELANGRPEHALSYGMDYNYRMPKGTDLKTYYQGIEKKMGETLEPYRHLHTWLKISPIKQLTGDGMQGKLEFLGFGLRKRDPQWEFIGVDYRYTPSSDEFVPVEFRIVMLRRDWGPPFDFQWRFREFELLKGPRQGSITIGRPPGAPAPERPPAQAGN